MARWAAKVDANQADMIAALEAAGVHALSMARLGGGWPDLLTWGEHLEHGHVVAVPVEVKAPGGTLTDAERKWREKYTGPYIVARVPSDVLIDGYGWSTRDAATVDAHYYRLRNKLEAA
jgi:hypothetical protein